MDQQPFVEVGTHLRLVALGIECVWGEGMRRGEVDRAIEVARADQVAEKRSTFVDHRGVLVEGRIDEYEPASVLVTVRGHRTLSERLPGIVESARVLAAGMSGDPS